MSRADFEQNTFVPLTQKYFKEISAYVPENKMDTASSIACTIDRIANVLQGIELTNKKYIAMSLSRTHLSSTGEFLYAVKVFDDEFNNSKELGDNCLYHASWLTDKWGEFNTKLNEAVKKSMIKHDPIFIEELKSQVINDFNICFVRTAKNLLSEYTNELLDGMVIIAGDYIFDYKCLSNAKFEKIKEFGFSDVADVEGEAEEY